MNILKIIFVFFFILFSVFVMICAFIPGKWLITEEIVIRKPMAIVSFEMAKENANSLKEAFTSITIPVVVKPEGKTATGLKWKHSNEYGKYRITKANKTDIRFEMDFFKPYQSHGKGIYTLNDLGDSCLVTLSFEGRTPFFLRISNLFIDRHYQPFFKAHLESLKIHCEQQQNLPELEVRTFMGITMKGMRQSFSADSTDYYRAEILQNIERYSLLEGDKLSDPLSSLIYNEAGNNAITDRFYGLVSKGSLVSGVPNDTSNMGVTQIFIFNNYVESYLKGSHTELKRAHRNMQEWFIINDLRNKTPVMESYLQGPHNQTDTNAWLTRIIYSF